jgi:hypothetical protein
VSEVRSVLRVLVAITALGTVGTASMYPILGIDATLDLVNRIFTLTYPIVGGRAAFPLSEFDRGLFHAHTIALYAHVTAAPLALALGLLQLWPRFRAVRPRLHRAIGVGYLAAQLVGLPSGMWLARWEYGGLTATVGFFFMGATTLACSGLALRAISVGDRAAHRAWMVRGYVVMWSSSVLFRYYLFVALPKIAPDSFRELYVAGVFLSWALGLLAADVYLHVTGHTRSRRSPTVMAPGSRMRA